MLSTVISIPQSECVNLDYLTLKTKKNTELLLEMISIYITQTPLILNVCRQCLSDKDWEQMQLAIHKLIPSFWMMGIDPKYEKMAKQVQEYAATETNTERIEDLYLQLESICLQACVELKEKSKTIKQNQI